MESIVNNVREACQLGRARRTMVYAAIQKGELRAVKRGRRALILAQDWLESLLPFYQKSLATPEIGEPCND